MKTEHGTHKKEKEERRVERENYLRKHVVKGRDVKIPKKACSKGKKRKKATGVRKKKK